MFVRIIEATSYSKKKKKGKKKSDQAENWLIGPPVAISLAFCFGFIIRYPK